MLAEGFVGAGLAAEGAQVGVTFDKSKALRVSSLLQESLAGDVFYGSTAAAGRTPQVSLTTTAPFVVYNPIGSDVDLVVFAAAKGYVSGTLGAGCIVAGQYVVGTTNAVPTGTIALKGSTKLGSATPKATVLEEVTLTAGATLICALADSAPKLATSVVEGVTGVIPLPVPIVVPPGVAFVLGAVTAAAAGSPLMIFGAFWQEMKRISG